MREDLLNELDAEYAAQRNRNEQEEADRRERIRREFPEISRMMAERENLIFGTIHRMLDGNADTDRLEDCRRIIWSRYADAQSAGIRVTPAS